MPKLYVCYVAILLSLILSVPSWAYEKEINTLSAAMAEKIAKAERTSVAVVDFTDLEGNVTQLGRFIAEEFSTALAGAGKGFKVVDRTHLNSIIKENKLSATGLIDPKTARKLGKIIGVQALITGTLTPFGENVRIAGKILDTATAEMIDAIRGNIAKTQGIEELLVKGIAKKNHRAGVKPKVEQELGAAIATKEFKGFTFEVKQCKRSETDLTCSFLITSNKKDKRLKIKAKDSRYTVVYDDTGCVYYAKKVQVARMTDDRYIERRFILAVPTKVIFNFESIDTKAEIITLFEMECSVENENFQVHFRNIPLSK